MKKILFVNPTINSTVFGKMKMLALPPMGLGLLAAGTPDHYEVSIVDENVDTINFDTPADLVAVTATTTQAPRAYRIMDEFRRRGVPVVIGGIHASVMTEEAIPHADAVAVGEADDIWPVMLRDFEAGKLQGVYRAESFPSLKNIPRINRKLFSKKYMIHSVQTSRGCPCNCSFCSVTKFNGARYRFRSIDDVVDEIRGIKDKRFFIADDSIVGLGTEGIDHARELFRRLRGLGKSWGSQVCITIAEHDELLRDAARAGANTFYIGFESIEAEALKSMNKNINLRPIIKNYKETIKKFHEYGIGVIGGFILGTDADTRDIFDRTIEFVHETGIDGCQFTIMTPFPGTRLYSQVSEEGRLLYTNYPDDWVKYNAYEAVIRPRNMSVEDLQAGWRRVYDATSSLGMSLKRSLKTLVSTGSPVNATINLFWNYYNYKAIRDYTF
ncbi:MAG TPA: radical SAM protein [Spirochaetota bacterium]|nr:radical SAM protein [Spirochaetota bacterium]HPI90768.1 radical SAM protein [Spirochaetota bacterium]HPR48498.1 radical SAM protein [Spirochaetota bacterium]